MASGSSSPTDSLGNDNDYEASLLERYAAIIRDTVQNLFEDIKSGAKREPSLADRLKLLSEGQVLQLKLLLRTALTGKLTLLGEYACVTRYSEETLRKLFTIGGVNDLEKFDGHEIPLLHLAAYCGNQVAIKVLFQCAGVRPGATDDKRRTVLHMAVKSQDLDTVAITLSECHKYGSEVFRWFSNEVDEMGMTALQHAAWEGLVPIIKKLLQYDEIIVNEGGKHGFTALHLASWNGHVEVVKLLVEKLDRDIGLNVPTTESLYWISGGSSLAPRSREWTKNSLARRLYFQESHLVSFSGRRQTVLNLEKAKQGTQWSRNRDYGTKFLSLGLDVANIRGLTALHCAAYNGQAAIVKTIMDEMQNGLKLISIFNPVDELGLTPLHYAVVAADPATVEMLCNYKRVRADMIGPRSLSVTPLTMAHHLKERLQRRDTENIVSLLLEQSAVKAYLDRLYKDRQLFVDAANAILVGAALIASITFAGWLQPPLNYQQYYGADYLLTGAAPPDTYASYAAVRHHLGVMMFWIFNSLSFFFAIATVLLGACVVLPTLGNEELDSEVSRMRRVHIWTTLALNISVCFVLGAFIAAGFAVLPPTLKYQLNMIVTTLVGGSFAFGALCYYLYRVFTLIKKIEMKTQGIKTQGIKKPILQLKRIPEMFFSAVSRMTDKDSRGRRSGRGQSPPTSMIKLNNSIWEFYSPPDGLDPEMNIVFFHGFQVDSENENAFWKTWVAKDDADEVIWPIDWLSLHLPTARMFSVSYSAYATLHLNAFSEKLITDIILDNSSRIGQTCPLFLVGHSLGGVAIKQFILSALQARELVRPTSEDTMRYESFSKNLKGAFYYALPHSDTHLARFASRLKESPILSLLNEAIEQIDITDRDITDRIQLPSFAMVEGPPTFQQMRFDDAIVPESPGHSEDKTYTYSEADHFSVCQARDPNDPIVIAKLVEFINRILATRD